MNETKKCTACKIDRPLSDYVSKAGRTNLKNCQRCRNYRKNRNFKCEHGIGGYYCKDCEGKGLCSCGINWNTCRICNKKNRSVCECGKSGYCVKCHDPIKTHIIHTLRNLKMRDVKNGVFIEGNDDDDFIDYQSMKDIFDTVKVCYFCGCNVDLLSRGYFHAEGSSMCRIDRIDKTKAHTKNNCVVSCYKCYWEKNYLNNIII